MDLHARYRAEIPRYMDCIKYLDIAGWLPVVLHTCIDANPVKSEPLAPSLRLCNWLRACGPPARSAPQAALSAIVAVLMSPRRLSASANWPAASASAVPPQTVSSRHRSGA